MNKRKCTYCHQEIDLDNEKFVRPDKIKWAHLDCYENFLDMSNVSIPEKEKIVVCFYCEEPFVLKDHNYRMARVNRYAHKECFEQNATEDDKYIDFMYHILTRNGVKYNFHKCERQRKKFLNEGYKNKGMALTLQYFYEVQKGDVNKSNGGIGIIPYVYDRAFEYFRAKEMERRRLQALVLQSKEEEDKAEKITVQAPKKQKRKKDLYVLDDIDIEGE